MKKLLRNQPDQTDKETASPARATRLLLRTIRATQPISRIELARRLALNRSTVTDIINPLIAAHLIREEPLTLSAKKARLQGRPPMGLRFNSDNDFFIGVNIGVRHSQIGLITLSGEILAEDEFETPSQVSNALKLITDKIMLLSLKGAGRKLRVIGVSVPGPTNPARNQLLYAPHLGWKSVEIGDLMREAFASAGFQNNYSIVVENDATASAMYEARLYLRKNNKQLLKNFVLLRSGTGLGIGLVINGEVFRGTGLTTGIAGEFGHMTIVAGGKACACGNRGCWEKYAAASAASSLYTGDRSIFGGAKPPHFIQIVERAEAGETRAQRTLQSLGNYLGIGIGNVITALGVPHIIVSGRLVYGWKYIKQPLFNAVDKSMGGQIADWTIKCGEPKGAVIGGALELAIEEFLTRGFLAQINEHKSKLMEYSKLKSKNQLQAI